MKNMSLWAVAAVLLLVGAAVWYEVQYRQTSTQGAGTPVRHVSAKKKPPQQPAQPKGPIVPTNDRGQFIG